MKYAKTFKSNFNIIKKFKVRAPIKLEFLKHNGRPKQKVI
jgi:hypothetical protein